MATSFRREYEVTSRLPGMWIRGHYHPETNTAVPRMVMMTIQNPSAGDKNAIEALPMGQRVSRFIKIYTDERLIATSQLPGGDPGDLVNFDGKTWVIIGETNFTALKQTQPLTPVSHFRYYAALLIEADGIQVPVP